MKSIKYESRIQAGKFLTEFIKKQDNSLFEFIIHNAKEFFCLAIPNGGVPVTEGFCSNFNLYYDVLIVRKIKIPYNTEAGFGAITTDDTILFNESLLNQLNLSETAIKESINLTKHEIQDRIKFYKKDFDLNNYYTKLIRNKNIILLDDGLASGFTMLAGINMIKKYKPNKIYVIVPTAPLRTIKKIENLVDKVFCPNIKDTLWFAVADAYKHWYDVPESEVLDLINKSKYYIVNI